MSSLGPDLRRKPVRRRFSREWTSRYRRDWPSGFQLGSIYSNNRADNAYIPGAVIPGYIIIKPDFPECIDDFGFLWYEDEVVVAGSASGVVAGNAAEAITKEPK